MSASLSGRSCKNALEYGYHPEIILAGQWLNENVGKYVDSELVKLTIARYHNIKRTKVLLPCITFKENCPYIRNHHLLKVIAKYFPLALSFPTFS